MLWFFFALGSAIAQSTANAFSNQAVQLGQYSKLTLALITTATSSLILFAVTILFLGIPDLAPGFWTAVLITGTLNAVMIPLGFKAYEYGEFSSVYSMSLTTPIFLLLTGWIFLGEVPPVLGMVGVVLTVLGLWEITRANPEGAQAKNYKLGNLLGLVVAVMASISVNFDKLATLYSSRTFSYAVIMGIVALGYGVYLLFSKGSIIVKTGATADYSSKGKFIQIFFYGLFLMFLAGVAQAANGYLYNSALATGLASYTIAIKRVGVLLGIFWGWLFFREKNISKKLFSVVIAIAGVILILLS